LPRCGPGQQLLMTEAWSCKRTTSDNWIPSDQHIAVKQPKPAHHIAPPSYNLSGIKGLVNVSSSTRRKSHVARVSAMFAQSDASAMCNPGQTLQYSFSYILYTAYQNTKYAPSSKAKSNRSRVFVDNAIRCSICVPIGVKCIRIRIELLVMEHWPSNAEPEISQSVHGRREDLVQNLPSISNHNTSFRDSHPIINIFLHCPMSNAYKWQFKLVL